jgi:hypothetical protein
MQPDDFRQLWEWLGARTQQTLRYLVPDGWKPGLVRSGNDIIELWRRFEDRKLSTQRGAEPRREDLYGLYFILLNHEPSGVPRPFYVGKGELPYRLLQHFGLGAYVDQLLSSYLGGPFGRPWREEQSKQDALRSKLDVFQLGLVGLVRSTGSERINVASYEKQFIELLRPMANRVQGRKRDLNAFEVAKLADEWSGYASPSEIQRLRSACDQLCQAAMSDPM